MTTFKDGKTKAINFSYFSPYDVLQAPIQSAINKAAAQELNPEETEDYILGLMFDPHLISLYNYYFYQCS